MACASIIGALKKSAESRNLQELYQVAYNLNGRFLDQVSVHDPDLMASMETAMAQIKIRLECFGGEENHLPGNLTIARIKNGFRETASRNDTLISARALRDLGLFGAALAQYRNLLAKKFITAEVAQGVTDGLVLLVPPDLFPRALDLFVHDIFQIPKNILMFKLLIAKKLNMERNPHHFLSLYRYLSRIKQVPAPIRKHIQSLEDRSRSISFADSGEDAYGPVANLDALFSNWTRDDDQSTIDSSETNNTTDPK